MFPSYRCVSLPPPSTLPTVGVRQVTGEISNNGERMRRFMQTFVLAPQAERNFYAHNTMFRYQDEVYTDDDEEEEEEADSEGGSVRLCCRLLGTCFWLTAFGMQ